MTSGQKYPRVVKALHPHPFQTAGGLRHESDGLGGVPRRLVQTKASFVPHSPPPSRPPSLQCRLLLSLRVVLLRQPADCVKHVGDRSSLAAHILCIPLFVEAQAVT